MVESRPLEKTLSHVTLIVGIAIITFPLFIALVASPVCKGLNRNRKITKGLFTVPNY